MNYIGYFRGLHSDILYSVKLGKDLTSTEYTEILLAGEEPFVVNYKSSETPFDPSRTSNASIRIVHTDYLEDILPSEAQETKVILTNETSNTVVWCGYLTPKVYDQGYVEEYETIELDANDCLSTLKYYDYELESGTSKSMVTFHSILKRLCDKCGLLDGFIWAKTKKVDGNYLFPTELKISEQNFFTNDTDEPWKMNEVLDEMCKYVGLTAIQWNGMLYLADYQAFHNGTRMYGASYLKSSNYSKVSNNFVYSEPFSVSGDTYMGNNSTITFKPVYNKVTVNDNFYDAEYFIPNIFDDNFLTNRIDEDAFYANYEVLPETPNIAQFPKALRKNNSSYEDDKPNKDSAGDADYRYFHRLYDHKYWESVYHTEQGAETTPSASIAKTSAITRNYMGGTIVDLGTVRKEYLSEYSQWIVPNKLDYTRYLCLCCKFNDHNHKYYSQYPQTTPYYQGPFYMFKLKDGYKSPCVFSNNSFIVINYSMIWERYNNRAYINPDWMTDKVGLGGLQSGSAQRSVGNLNFVLKIGDKYWDGYKWTTTYSAFSVVCERTSKQIDVWNEELSVLNNISWDLYVNEEGYKIPLENVDTTQEIQFIVLRPRPQFQWNSGNNAFKTEFGWNAYCWVKDLSIKCVQVGQDLESEENDVVYTNSTDDMNENSINELDEISLKFTTWTEMTKPSFSNVIYEKNGVGGFLQTVSEASIRGVSQKPEENIIEKFVMQYNTPTKEFSLPLNMSINPFTKVFYADVDDGEQGYCVKGSQINYREDTQTIKLEEKK